MLIPQDAHLARLIDRAAQALAETGLTTQDLLDELPDIRREVVRDLYGDAYVADLEREHGALRERGLLLNDGPVEAPVSGA